MRSLPTWTDSTSAIYDTAGELYRGLGLDRPRVRLVGVKCENFRDAAEAPEQLTLDAFADTRDRTGAERVIDAARLKFGADVVSYGTLLPIPAQTDTRRGED